MMDEKSKRMRSIIDNLPTSKTFQGLKNKGDHLIARTPYGGEITIWLNNMGEPVYPKSAIPLPKPVKPCICCGGRVNHDELN